MVIELMLFSVEENVMKNFFVLPNKFTRISMPNLDNFSILKEIWYNSTYKTNKLKFNYIKELKIEIGNAEFIALQENQEYTIKITENGVGILAKDKNSLIRGFMALLIRFIAKEINGKNYAVLPIGEIVGDFSINLRIAQICIFPEYSYNFIRKLARYLCALQYTHIQIEMFGTYRFKCLKELGFKGKSISTKKLKKVINDIRALGAEPIPMFNSLGHAFGARGCTGKHVVLDQNPSLAHLFTPDGWSWDITNPKVPVLLKNIRKELYKLFGDGEYFFIGCDECEIYTKGYAPEETVINYLNNLTTEIVNEGRKPVIWADLMLYRPNIKEHEIRVWSANAHSSQQAERFISAIHKNTIIADWQYQFASKSPCEQYTAIDLNKKGFNVISCSFFDLNVIRSATKTVIDHSLFGYMQTIWDRAHELPWIYLDASILCGMPTNLWYEYGEASSIICGSVLRKVSCGSKKYKNFGFNDVQFIKNTRQSN